MTGMAYATRQAATGPLRLMVLLLCGLTLITGLSGIGVIIVYADGNALRCKAALSRIPLFWVLLCSALYIVLSAGLALAGVLMHAAARRDTRQAYRVSSPLLKKDAKNDDASR